MDQVLTKAFDGLTIEEISSIFPQRMTMEADRETLAHIRNRVLERLGAAAKAQDTAFPPQQPAMPMRKRQKLTRTLLIAAVITLLAAVGALALSPGGGRFLASLFGQENFDIVEQYIMADLAQTSDGRFKLTLESALSDGHDYYVVFSVGSLDGSSLGGRFPDVRFSFDLETPSRIMPGFQLERLDTGENTDNCAYYIALIRSSQSAIRSMRMEISRMFAFDGSLEDIPADLSAEAEFAPCPLSVGGAEDGAFRNIELSPFGLWIDVYEEWEGTDALSRGLPLYDIFLLYQDGSRVGAKAEQFADPDYLEALGWGGMQMPNGTHQSYISVRFIRFVDIGKVKAVIIQGREYPLSMAGN